LVIQAETSDFFLERGIQTEYVQAKFPDLAPDVISNFQAKVGEPIDPGIIAALRPGAIAITAAERQQLFAVDDGWSEFARRYPQAHGIVTFGPVSFSNDGKKAFTYIALHCGYTCGVGYLVSLNAIDTGWVIGGQAELWVS
jgi:hypothetical protein